jgi:hypothetical protein
MKKLKLIPFLLTLLLIGFILSSCGKTEPNDSAQTFTWKANGTEVIGGNRSWAQKMTAPQTTVIYGEADANTKIQFTLMHCDTVGTYVAKLISQEPNSAYVYLEAAGVVYESDYCKNGEQVLIRVTELSSLMIKGNFVGPLRSADSSLMNISGSFDLKLRQVR